MSEPPSGTVTLLFTDVEGSTRLLQRAGDAYAGLLADHRRLLREVFARHRGFEMDSEGDAFFVAFESANDAVAAAADAQAALAQHDWPDGNEVRVRIGLHTGEPRAVDGRYVGLVVHAAARIMAAGHGGQVLVSQSTRPLLDERFQLRDLGAHRLKDLPGTQQLYQLHVEGQPTDFPPLKPLDHRPTNLPLEPNAFIGRTRELKEAWALLTREDARLLTLTGTGGGGKTRLALRLAAGAEERFPNGVFFVSLAPVRDWELVIPSIAQTLGLREQPGETVLETLTEYVQDRRILLLLDNFEQVLPAAPAVAGLLASAPGLMMLATSRTPLRLAGVRTYSVPPLGASESVNLFVERAQAADADFAVTDANARDVAEICTRLDGLPLAIELAAPRVRALSPAALLRRLDDRLKLLTGGAHDLDERQRTLRATIEWSYDLLPDAERALFAQLGVFLGGCRQEAAEALCSADLDILDGLQSLVENSLLRRRADSDGEPRFWMLETIREYACELLERDGDAEEARRRHAAYFAENAEALDVESRTGEHSAVLDRLDEERGNLRGALDWAREHGDADLRLRLAKSLWGFWAARGYVTEGRAVLVEALVASSERPVLEAMRGDFALARELLADGARTLSEVGLRVWAANTAQEAFMIESLAGSPEAATGVLLSSYETFEEMGERGFRSTIAGFLADALYAQGEYAESARFSRTCEEAAAPDDALSKMLWRRSRAQLLAHEGDLERGEALAREAVQLGEQTDFDNDHADALLDLAESLALCGRRAEALTGIETAASRYERKGNLPSLERAQRLAQELSTQLPSG